MSGNTNNRSYPAMVIYNMDGDDAGPDAGQTLVFQREEPCSEAQLDDWAMPMNVQTSVSFPSYADAV